MNGGNLPEWLEHVSREGVLILQIEDMKQANDFYRYHRQLMEAFVYGRARSLWGF